MIFRVVFAFILAALVMPTAGNLTPDAMPAPGAGSAQLQPLPEPVTRLIEQSASAFGVPQPRIRFVDSVAAGYTQRLLNEQRSDIQLGRPVQTSTFLTEKPELLQAIAGHEFGHAVLNARGQDFPAYWILVMYGAGLVSLLAIQPTRRGAVAVFGFCVAFIAGWSTLVPEATLHSIYLELLHALCFLSVLGGVLVHNGLVKVPGVLAGFRLPGPKAWILAAALSMVLYYSVGFMVGRANAKREFTSDLIGACVTSPASMRDALLELRKGHAVSVFKEWFDFFHPAMNQRVQRLDVLQGSQFEAACASLRAGAPVET